MREGVANGEQEAADTIPVEDNGEQCGVRREKTHYYSEIHLHR